MNPGAEASGNDNGVQNDRNWNEMERTERAMSLFVPKEAAMNIRRSSTSPLTSAFCFGTMISK